MTDIDDIQALWSQQPVVPPEVDMIALEKKADRFDSQIKARNAIEWLAATVVVVVFVVMAFDADHPLVTRIGSTLIALGAIVVARRLYVDGRTRRLPDAAQDTRAYIDSYRRNLEQQAELLEEVPRWYLAPLAPGLLTFFVGFIVHEPRTWVVMVPMIVGVFLVYLGIAYVNRVAAGKLRRRAGELSDS